MSDERTVPHRVTRVPVQSLSVEVLDGPDKGVAIDVSGEALVVGSAADANLVLSDATVSRYHVELRIMKDGIAARDLGSTNGSFIGPVRIVECVVPPGTLLRLGRSTIRAIEGRPCEVEQSSVDAVAGLRGHSPKMRRVFAQLDRAAQADASVLVVGESGTGKELVARALHELGPRRGRPFVTVDCGSLAPTLIASELFGHERGAFTGAERQHIGAFEQADGGTIFLDEIGELPAALQSSLLGVLERRRFKRLGGRSEIGVDVRVVSATHRDLRSAVNANTFRLDLFYRLAVISIELPPLRDRREDIPLLVAHFLREGGHEGNVDELVPPPAMLDLMAHTWPGNVRELRNVVESTVTMGHPPSLRSAANASLLDPGSNLAPALSPAPATGDVIEPLLGLPYKDARLSILNDFESRYLTDLFSRAEGNVSRAAREARVDRSHLIELLQRHGIRRPR
jgi:DNA-binding NtrC family response regulator